MAVVKKKNTVKAAKKKAMSYVKTANTPAGGRGANKSINVKKKTKAKAIVGALRNKATAMKKRK